MNPISAQQETLQYNSDNQQINDDEINVISDYNVEDRRRSEVQFDFAEIQGENGCSFLAMFDTASNTTLILRELIENGTVRAKYTNDIQLVKGTGNISESADVAEVVLTRTDGKTIKVHALVVDNIINTEIKSKYNIEHVTQQCVEKLKKISGYDGIREENFQQVLGGRVEVLFGQNVGLDFFPIPVLELEGGLRISKMRIPLQDENRYLSFSGRLPTSVIQIYNKDESI